MESGSLSTHPATTHIIFDLGFFNHDINPLVLACIGVSGGLDNALSTLSLTEVSTSEQNNLLLSDLKN